ncbi:MAG TPA: hypothetical protein VN408_40945, partial [Actinoplanes sp.]|nr:hypothetical protein [Actinoplanes sp.]
PPTDWKLVTMPIKASRVRLLWIAVIWLAGNLLIGLFAIFPISVVDTLIYYIRAANGDDVVQPYGPVGARFAVAVIAVTGALLLIAAVLFNRRQWSRLRNIRPVGSMMMMMMMLVTILPWPLPFLWFYFGTDRTF